jgi:large subunit ribosomal protein L35
MPKAIARSKTKKSVAKRFKLTATGKVVRSKAGRRHLLQSKSSKRKRKMGKSVVVDDTDVSRIKLNLPFGLR